MLAPDDRITAFGHRAGDAYPPCSTRKRPVFDGVSRELMHDQRKRASRLQPEGGIFTFDRNSLPDMPFVRSGQYPQQAHDGFGTGRGRGRGAARRNIAVRGSESIDARLKRARERTHVGLAPGRKLHQPRDDREYVPDSVRKLEGDQVAGALRPLGVLHFNGRQCGGFPGSVRHWRGTIG